jgi:hypothetical protein
VAPETRQRSAGVLARSHACTVEIERIRQRVAYRKLLRARTPALPMRLDKE